MLAGDVLMFAQGAPFSFCVPPHRIAVLGRKRRTWTTATPTPDLHPKRMFDRIPVVHPYKVVIDQYGVERIRRRRLRSDIGTSRKNLETRPPKIVVPRPDAPVYKMVLDQHGRTRLRQRALRSDAGKPRKRKAVKKVEEEEVDELASNDEDERVRKIRVEDEVDELASSDEDERARAGNPPPFPPPGSAATRRPSAAAAAAAMARSTSDQGQGAVARPQGRGVDEMASRQHQQQPARAFGHVASATANGFTAPTSSASYTSVGANPAAAGPSRDSSHFSTSAGPRASPAGFAPRDPADTSAAPPSTRRDLVAPSSSFTPPHSARLIAAPFAAADAAEVNPYEDIAVIETVVQSPPPAITAISAEDQAAERSRRIKAAARDAVARWADQEAMAVSRRRGGNGDDGASSRRSGIPATSFYGDLPPRIQRNFESRHDPFSSSSHAWEQQDRRTPQMISTSRNESTEAPNGTAYAAARGRNRLVEALRDGAAMPTITSRSNGPGGIMTTTTT